MSKKSECVVFYKVADSADYSVINICQIKIQFQGILQKKTPKVKKIELLVESPPVFAKMFFWRAKIFFPTAKWPYFLCFHYKCLICRILANSQLQNISKPICFKVFLGDFKRPLKRVLKDGEGR